jgi:hypothetical protein
MTRPATSVKQLAERTFDLTTCTHMWFKLRWEIELLEHVSSPPVHRPEALSFCAVNICITAASLIDRVWADLRRSGLSAPAGTKEKFRIWIRERIGVQEACETIANTVKHGGVRPENWVGGVARVSPVVPNRLHGRAGEPFDADWKSKADIDEVAWTIGISFPTTHGSFGGVGSLVFHQLRDEWRKIIQELGLWSLDPPWSRPPPQA